MSVDGVFNSKGSDRPDIRDLNEHVIPNIPADKWEEIGAELLSGNTAELSHIRAAFSDTPLRCRLTFEKWLNRRDANWDRLVSVLEKVQLTYLADTVKMLLKTAGTSNSFTDSKQPVSAQQLENQKIFSLVESHPLEFSPSTTIASAFTRLSEKCLTEFANSPLDKIKRWCQLYSKQFHQQPLDLDSATSVDNLFQSLQKSPYYNCFNLGLVKYLADVSENQCLIDSVKNYEKAYFDVKLEDLIPRDLMVYHGERAAKAKVRAKVKSMTVNELQIFCIKLLRGVLYLEASDSLPSHIKRGCVCATWFIPSSLADHACHSACINTKLMSELKVTSITIGRYNIEPVENCLRVTPVHIIINHYLLLLQQLKSLKVAEVMMSHNLLSELDHKIILDAPLDHIRNCYILEHVHRMTTPKLFTFIDILKEIPDQKHLYNMINGDLKNAGFTCLQDGPSDLDTEMDDSNSENYLLEPSHIARFNTVMKAINLKKRTYLMPEIQTRIYLKPANVVASFIDLFDKVASLLQSCEVETVVHLLNSHTASDTYDISLFPDEYITNLRSFTDTAVLLRTLFPYSNWYDHSIIRELVGACDCPEAERVLDEFDSHIDPTIPITDYPIPVYSSTMIPNKSSTHTVMAVAYNKELSSVSLQNVEVVKSIMVQKFCITKHACLLLAVADCGGTILYWLIPTNVSSVILKKAQECADDLSMYRILEVAIYPSVFIPTGGTDRIWSLAYAMDLSGMLKYATEKCYYLQNELKFSKQISENFSVSAEALQTQNKELQQKITEEIGMEVMNLHKIFADCKREFDEETSKSPVVGESLQVSEVASFTAMEGIHILKNDIGDLKKVAKQFKSQHNKLQMMQLQVNEEVEQLNIKLKLKDEEVKKSKENIRLLTKIVTESKQAKLPNVNGNKAEAAISPEPTEDSLSLVLSQCSSITRQSNTQSERAVAELLNKEIEQTQQSQGMENASEQTLPPSLLKHKPVIDSQTQQSEEKQQMLNQRDEAVDEIVHCEHEQALQESLPDDENPEAMFVFTEKEMFVKNKELMQLKNRCDYLEEDNRNLKKLRNERRITRNQKPLLSSLFDKVFRRNTSSSTLPTAAILAHSVPVRKPTDKRSVTPILQSVQPLQGISFKSFTWYQNWLLGCRAAGVMPSLPDYIGRIPLKGLEISRIDCSAVARISKGVFTLDTSLTKSLKSSSTSVQSSSFGGANMLGQCTAEIWIAISHEFESYIEVVSVFSPSEKQVKGHFVTKCPHIQCMMAVPGKIPVSEEFRRHFRSSLSSPPAELTIVSDNNDPLRKGSTSPDGEPAEELTMWIISENKRLYFHNVVKDYHRELNSIELRKRSFCIECAGDFVFIGQTDGELMILQKAKDDSTTWNIHKPLIVGIPFPLDQLTAHIYCIKAIGSKLWIAAGELIYIMDPLLLGIETIIDESEKGVPGTYISHIEQVKDVAVITFYRRSIIKVYKSETGNFIKEIDICSVCIILNKLPTSPCPATTVTRITSLSSSSNTLYVGTKCGKMIAFSVKALCDEADEEDSPDGHRKHKKLKKWTEATEQEKEEARIEYEEQLVKDINRCAVSVNTHKVSMRSGLCLPLPTPSQPNLPVSYDSLVVTVGKGYHRLSLDDSSKSLRTESPIDRLSDHCQLLVWGTPRENTDTAAV